jgi:hypothetical protein
MVQKITEECVKQLNDETTSDNFWDVVDKHELEVLEEFAFEILSEQDGIEVWGRSEKGEFLVYDSEGWYLLSSEKWVSEVQKYLVDNYNYDFDNQILTLEEMIRCLEEHDLEEQ